VPLVSISTQTLRKLVGKSLGRDELVSALEQLGNNVDGTATVSLYRCGRCGHLTETLEHADFDGQCTGCGSKEIELAGSSEVIRISLLPVRPDMFDAAGLARALRGYLDIETGLPNYRLEPSGLTVGVQPGLENIRPWIVVAVVRGLSMDDETVKTIMKMQENLHWALGRDRRRASIGVYDLDTVEPDFEYSAVSPEGVKFVPLFGMPEGEEDRQERQVSEPERRMVAVTPKEILERHPKGSSYQHLLAPFPAWPLLSDSNGKVLSLPPIINSEETRVTSRTRNLFVDVTGPDRHAIARALAVIACGLADLGAKVETVSIVYPDGTRVTTPDLTPEQRRLETGAVTRVLGFEVPDVVQALRRMRYDATLESGQVRLAVPAYRADVMHDCDIIEDVAIAHGYHNVRPRLVPSMTLGDAQLVEELSAVCRRVMTGLGFLETMTLMLTNEQEHYTMLLLPVPDSYCHVGNPASVEQTMMRCHLISGQLATLRVNVAREMPQCIFEVGDCFSLDPAEETGVRTERRLAAAVAGPKAGFADVRAWCEALARELGLAVGFRPTEHPTFISGRVAAVRVGNADRGVVGEIHPAVLEAFGLSQPVALFEVNLSSAT